MSRFLPFLAVLITLAGCGGGSEQPTPAPEATLKVTAGSELKDIEPKLADIEKATGVHLQLVYSGTLDGIERIGSGESFDAAWFSHAKYLALAYPDRIKAQEKTMLSPVILGVRESKARQLGWLDNPNVTWSDIAKAAGAGKFNYAMTNPTSSNTGFSAVIGVVAALSGSGDSLKESDIDRKALQRFFSGQKLTAGSSGWLADTFVKDEERLDGIINYESVLLSLNRSGRLKEKLSLIYPKEGIVTADYPLVLLNPEKRALYDKVVEYLRGADFQRWMMDQTYRRPISAEVPLSNVFPDKLLVELPFPNNLAVVDKVLLAYLNEYRRPAYSIFLLDVSGSMAGDRLSQLKGALNGLAGGDQTLTGRFARFQARETIELIPFSQRVVDDKVFNLGDAAAMDADLGSVRAYVDGLQVSGGTAIFGALQDAYEKAMAARAADPGRNYSIVLMSDGQNTAGIPWPTFVDFYRQLPSEARDIRVFPIVFGDADAKSMQEIANLTGGKVFDGQKVALNQVFKAIRGYQ